MTQSNITFRARLNTLLKQSDLALPTHRVSVDKSGSNLMWLRKHVQGRSGSSPEIDLLLKKDLKTLLEPLPSHYIFSEDVATDLGEGISQDLKNNTQVEDYVAPRINTPGKVTVEQVQNIVDNFLKKVRERKGPLSPICDTTTESDGSVSYGVYPVRPVKSLSLEVGLLARLEEIMSPLEGQPTEDITYEQIQDLIAEEFSTPRYTVVCDSNNNSDEDIKSGKLHVDIREVF